MKIYKHVLECGHVNYWPNQTPVGQMAYCAVCEKMKVVISNG